MTKIFLTGNTKLNEEIKSFFSACEFTDKLDDNVDLIIDSISFPEYKKIETINFIDEHFSKNIPVLTSSLCVSVSEQSSFSKYPNRLIGIGLYPTFSQSKLFEIAPSKITDEKVKDNLESLLKSLNVNYSIVPDKPGLVFPRILSMIINEAAQVYSENIASRNDIDTAMKLGTNYPFGPFEWADKLGIDLVYNILLSLHQEFGEDRYRPHPSLKEMMNLNLKFY